MNIYLRKDGRYESRISNGKKNDGKRAFLYVLARTREQCIERVQALCQRNKPQGYCALTVAELFTEWHRSILHRVKESTAANYSMKADKHILPAFGNKGVSTITADHIYSFISDKQKEGFSPRYIADIVILMKTIFKYAVRTYQISTRWTELFSRRRSLLKSNCLTRRNKRLYNSIFQPIRTVAPLELPCL